MKRIIIASLLVLQVLKSFAKETEVKTTLKEVMVFTQGGVLSHTADCVFEKGQQTIWLKSVSSQIDPNSIIVSLPKSIILQSVTASIVPMQKKDLNDADKQVLDSMIWVDQQITHTNTELLTEQYGIDLLKKNDQIMAAKDTKPADVITAYNEYKKLINISQNRIIELNSQRDHLNLIKSLLQNKINDLGLSQKNEAVIEVVVQSNETIKGEIALSYFTTLCGWQPSYLISNNNASNFIDLSYKSRIFQNTGFDWKNVQLSVATGNPNLANNQPVMTPWFLRYYSQNSYGYVNVLSNNGKQYKTELAKISEDDATASAIMEQRTVESQNTVTNNIFEINTPYTIKTNSTPSNVELKNYHLPANIYFYAAPKMDPDVFMLASFTMNESYELIPGEAIIMNEGIYVGKTSIDPKLVNDTMRLSLGRVPSITVKRELIKSKCTSQTFGNKKITNKYYTFKVYNGLNREINLVVKDQIPISTLGDVTVTLTQKSDGILNEQSGIITWEMDMKAKASKSFDFGFDIKHPKDNTLEGI